MRNELLSDDDLFPGLSEADAGRSRNLFRPRYIGEQGVITIAVLSVLKLVLDAVYAVLPDWDIQSSIASFNTTQDIMTVHYDNQPPWVLIMGIIGRFDVIFPIRETFQLIGLAVVGYGFIWIYYFVWKFIKTLRGSG